jgi:hypothetical protein
MNLESSVKFSRRIGIELTFVPNRLVAKLDNDYNSGTWAALAGAYQSLCDLHNLENVDEIGADPGCIEYPSPIFTTWSQARKWWHKATEVAGIMNLTTYHPEQEGGMGHIHVDVTRREAIIVHADMHARPYLTWILATPNGSEYCESLIGSYLLSKKQLDYPLGQEKKPRKIHKQGVVTAYTYIDRYYGSQSGRSHESDANISNRNFEACPYRPHIGNGTIEWRLFDAAATWEIQAEHIAFVQRYMATLLKARKYTPAPFLKDRPQKEWKAALTTFHKQYRDNIDLCIKEFKALVVDTLELPWKRYEWYIERNLAPAFEWGKRM